MSDLPLSGLRVLDLAPVILSASYARSRPDVLPRRNLGGGGVVGRVARPRGAGGGRP